MEIYLDNSATTQVLPKAVSAMNLACSSIYGNPSSLHGKGLQAEKQLTKTREILADVLSCKADEFYFTSGGTEANNWAILGSVFKRSRRGKHLITTKIEHPSVLKVFQFLEQEGFQVTYLDADSNGVVSVDQLQSSLNADTVLVSVMYVNNETGAIQPIEAIGQAVEEFNSRIVFHVDAVQALGKLPLIVGKSPIDLMSLSSHKIHGPKGTGALFIRKGVAVGTLLLGGEQEKRKRPGTENVPGIAGFGAALEAVPRLLETSGKIASLREILVNTLSEQLPEMVVNGSAEHSVPHIVNLSFPGIKAEVLVHYLEQSGIFVSTGAACYSKSGDGSHVLAAMGIEGERLEGAIRVSFSHLNTEQDVAFVADKITEAVLDLQSLR